MALVLVRRLTVLGACALGQERSRLGGLQPAVSV